jgi:hypothetical protein
MFPRTVPKLFQILTFLATIKADRLASKMTVVIGLLALSRGVTCPDFDWRRGIEPPAEMGNFRAASCWGTWAMLSVDQFLRLIFLPAVVIAFLIASQISGAFAPRPAPMEAAHE